MKWYVYVYYDPESGVPFYVGKGAGNRQYFHLKRKGSNKRLIGKLTEIKNKSLTPKIVQVAFFYKEVDAYNFEQDYIKELGRIEDGGTLLNLVLGGLGVKCLVQKNNPKVVEAARRNAELVNNNPEAVQKRSDFLKEYGQREEVKALRKELTTNLHKDKERHAKMVSGLAKGNTPEMWAARSEKMKLLYADPEWNRRRVEKSVASRLRNAELRKQGKL